MSRDWLRRHRAPNRQNAKPARTDKRMPNVQEQSDIELVELTAVLVSAFVSNTPVPVSSLADLISSVHASLSAIGKEVPPPAEPLTPAVNPKRSVTPDFI